MKYTKQALGRPAVFLLPSLKLKRLCDPETNIEDMVGNFLLKHFGGYTVTAGNIFGYWKNARGEVDYGEHRVYTVAFPGTEKISMLERFLAKLASDIGEESVYLETGEDAWLIYPETQTLSGTHDDEQKFEWSIGRDD